MWQSEFLVIGCGPCGGLPSVRGLALVNRFGFPHPAMEAAIVGLPDLPEDVEPIYSPEDLR